MKSVFIWGGTGQFKVIKPILKLRYSFFYVYDRDDNISLDMEDVLLTSDYDVVKSWMSQDLFKDFSIALGGFRGEERLQIRSTLLKEGLNDIPPLVHERAWVSDTSTISDGCHILAMSSISEFCTIGEYSIINTNASVDHDCTIGKGVHIMPGATVAGAVFIGDYSSIGSGAVILPKIKIGSRSVIGAGAVVTRDLWIIK